MSYGGNVIVIDLTLWCIMTFLEFIMSLLDVAVILYLRTDHASLYSIYITEILLGFSLQDFT